MSPKKHISFPTKDDILDFLKQSPGKVSKREIAKAFHIRGDDRIRLKKLLKELPSLKRPTVSPLSEKGWMGVNTVILKTDFHKLIPKLRKIAQGIVVHEPRQILQLEGIKRDEEN